jgi:hypothetical protein
VTTDKYGAAARFVDWLAETAVARARGEGLDRIEGKPADRFWLGRVAPTALAAASGADERMERLEPCAIGFRLRLQGSGPWTASAQVKLRLWGREKTGGIWKKLEPISEAIELEIPAESLTLSHGATQLQTRLQDVSDRPDISAEVVTELTFHDDGPELTITLVNTSVVSDKSNIDPRFYEATLEVGGLATRPFMLDSLEETYRYDRTVPAYGLFCGVRKDGNRFTTIDAPFADKSRPIYWGGEGKQPDLRFQTLADHPVEVAKSIVQALKHWGDQHWSNEALSSRRLAESWTAEMWAQAQADAEEFWEEVRRVERGAQLLEADSSLQRAFKLMNAAMQIVGARKHYDDWRPFQFGFLLANLASLVDPKDADIVDIVWFATGGGKTETYLGLLITAAFLDRLNGKLSGITAWSRFPLRMLSLQQMQRFADAMAAAEIVRRREKLAGDPFSVGFLVGNDAAPNKVRRKEQDKNSKYDPDDPAMPGRFRLLQQCPFCGSNELRVKFSTADWRLEHRCSSNSCEWPERALPFYVVDEEVFRFLPTVLVGTLDKAASVGMQQAMRGLVGAPNGRCSQPGHGFTYNRSSGMPTGCLVPDCVAESRPIDGDRKRLPPTYRLQDELHLLRDTLGAVDAHYEAALDGLQEELVGRKPKILASSATLSGYQKQAQVLYRRKARVFPQPPPSPSSGFWSKSGPDLMRRFVAIAPRGATIEFAVDRLINELQCAVRQLVSDPKRLCEELEIDPALAPFLLSYYGTDVVFGNTLRDLDAVARSSNTQLVDIPGPVNSASLTGRTAFDEVGGILEKLQVSDEKAPFEDRIHVVTASSMMSHGVDVDRLNVMIVLGMPLTTAEFIQATARVGRKYPAIVFVVHKMGRERDAGVFRSFEKFVEQGDRFVEPIPITGRSRRVLERTIPGLAMSRLLHIHAPTVERLTTATHARQLISSGVLVAQQEAEAVARYLAFDEVREEDHIEDIKEAIDRYFDRVNLPTTKPHEWIGSIWAQRPMTSLRDVEEQVPVQLKREQ